MKNSTKLSIYLKVAALCLCVGVAQSAGAAVSLPSDALSPVSAASERGMIVRTIQAPEGVPVDNTFLRALQQINGTLRDGQGALVPNDAVPGPEAGGAYYVDVVNFEKDGEFFSLMDAEGVEIANFTPGLFPGVPGFTGHFDSFAVEVVAFLDLPAGTHTMGVSVGTDRTDVNNDDGYQVRVGANPRDFFATKVGEFQRFAPPFSSNTKNENLFTITVPTAGVYPFRLVYWQTGLGANLQWYHIDPQTQARVLINDPADPRSIKAYRRLSTPGATSPYIGQVSPLPGSSGNSPSEAIEAVLLNGETALNDSSVKMFLNGAEVGIQRQREGNRLLVSYAPDSSRTNPDNQVRLEYADTAGRAYGNSWAFGIATGGAGATQVSGQWDFLRGDLRATIGQDLEYLDGPNGLTASNTRFGTTTALGIADIGGVPAQVMFVPGDLDRSIGYIMKHGIAPNGGGTRVNRYTLIMDVYVGTTGPGAASLLQISSLNNTDDGDLFWQGNNFGQGTDGYRGTGAFTAGEWHRVIAAYDMAADPPVVTKYVDGIKQDDWTANQGLDNPRRALLPSAILFADGDQDERREMYVSSIQIRSGKLSDAEMVLLGGPSAGGIPLALPRSNVTGQWDFERGDLSATIGKPLRYLDGEEGLTKAGTAFGTTTELGVEGIGGQEARVMYVPGDLSNKIGYIMEHGIAPNGGGTRVNQYTIIFDAMIGTSGPGAASMLQISSVANTDDGDLFWQGNNFGQGSNGYNGTGAFTAGEWHRVVAAYDMAATPPVVVKYVDGIFQDDWTANQGLDNPRRALLPEAVLFADGDADERREWWVSSIQIRSGALSKAQIEALGGPSAAGIPVGLPGSTEPEPPLIQIVGITAAGLTLTWAAELGLVLESTTTLTNPSWSAVEGVVSSTITVPVTGQARFFRLRR
jgi:hypothetical protein